MERRSIDILSARLNVAGQDFSKNSMVFAVHLLTKHSLIYIIGVFLPILFFVYFGRIRLSPPWIQSRVLANAEFYGISGRAIEKHLFGSKEQNKYRNIGLYSDDFSISSDFMWSSDAYRSFIDRGLGFKPLTFDPSVDVLVLLHIQKTGGSAFGRLLALELANLTCSRLDVGRKQHDCSVSLKHISEDSENRAIWMFSRFSVGWACGLHADWTELSACVTKVLNAREGRNRTRRYHYITMLREPISRYVSEWRHIARGATWAGAELRCNGRQASLSEVPFCYEGNNWRGVSIEKFLSCEHNLANNRQTRMLADLTKINCYNKTGMNPQVRSDIMLRSALENLASFSFIGLSEYQKLSQWLFERSFTNLRFVVNMTQKETKAEKFLPSLTFYDLYQVRRVNSLDVILYDFAKSLFFERIAAYGKYYSGFISSEKAAPGNVEFSSDEDSAYRRR